jgi:molybdopterin molybdotransferase
MRGFRERSLVQDALDWIDGQVAPLGVETINFDQAFGRVLATDVISQIDVPSFPRSAMDGYALRGAETTGAGDYNPLSFKIVGESMPGSPHQGEVSTGMAIRIMTGAPIPEGADAVVPAEYANESEQDVQIVLAVAPGKHVGQRGEDVEQGTMILKSGRRLRAQDLGLLGSIGVQTVDVVRQPSVCLLVTGDELVAAGRERSEFQIFDSNSVVLQALVARDGGLLQPVTRVIDSRDAIHDALTSTDVDVILVSGGSSVGREDHAPMIVAEAGELTIHGIAMRPSSPTGMGLIGRSLVFLLPGNPVSCMCAYDFFAGRAIRQLGGRNPGWPYSSSTMAVGAKIVSAIGRVDYCRVRFENEQVFPISLSGASILSSTTKADGFVIVPAENEGFGTGSNVTVYHYDSIG